jgi:heme exporter protein A
LRSGEATALLGPNGAGKSTLVGILATLVHPSSGQVRYGGREPDDELRRAIGVIAHESLCYGDKSGRENLEFFARLYDVAQPEARAAELLERVGLVDAQERPARTYSRGMMQRLSVARALVHHPQLLLCDEPFTGLDRAGVDLLGRLLAEERGRGAILVVVTHDFEAVAQLIDRVVVLARGRIARDEPSPVARTSAALAELYRTAAGARA